MGGPAGERALLLVDRKKFSRECRCEFRPSCSRSLLGALHVRDRVVAAAAGVVGTMVLLAVLRRPVLITSSVNGALAGLVAITAGCGSMEPIFAVITGLVAAPVAVFGGDLLLKLRVDDVVGAIPAHLVCGIWGTMIVPFSYTNAIAPNEAGDPSYLGQLVGVVLTGVFVMIASSIVWYILKLTIGVRPTAEEEEMGLDKAEIGLEAYPEFAN